MSCLSYYNTQQHEHTTHFLQLALPQMYRYDIIYHTLSIFAKHVLDKSITTHKSRQYLTRSAAKIHTETAVP